MLSVSTPAAAAEGCEVDYTVNEWNSGFTAGVEITNLGDAIDGWTLEWDFPGSQEITGAWNAETSQSGSTATAENVSYNAGIPTDGTASFGFQATHSGDNPAPESFTLNGTVCDGSTDGGGGDDGDGGDDGNGGGDDGNGDDGDQQPQPSGSPEGWASQNGGTTGGAGGETVTVSSADALTEALQSSGPTVVRLDGSVDLDGMNDIVSDKTLIGVGSDAEITGGGLDIDEAHNVIVRNIAFSDWGDDAINVQEGSTNVWIDHNSFTGGSDGAVDIKRESDYITVSWNHVYDHGKSMLLGHSDGHTEDEGHLRVSYHHNFFDGSGSRHPRVRFGETVHVYNNYYRDNAEYGVASTMGAGVLVEGNYFENVDNPTHVGYADSDDGRLVVRDNVFDNSGDPETAGSVAEVPYSYDLDSAQDVPGIVTSGAGPGNVDDTGGGDTGGDDGGNGDGDGNDDGGSDPQPSAELEGWATRNGGTTGGAGGETVTVSSSGALLDALQSSGPTVVRLDGSVDLSGMNDVASDKTLIGVGSDATVTGGGFDLNGVSNVVIRNINFDDWDDDAINVQESTTNVWIDHNSFGTGSDGAVDIKRESDFITVSWNYAQDHDHVMLLGHSDDHTEDEGHLRVSYHHNHFDGTYSRHPRVRFGEPVHVYNNYYDGVDTGVASTQGAGVLVEGNYFQDVAHPTLEGYGSSSDGRVELNGNVFDNSGEPESSGGVAEVPYSYDLDSAQDVPGIVSGGAGTGNI
ncbi:pectate lyase family protein [Streptomonospora litoralis]|uniref:pectate lyase family protein n=1 Tax=Streptomonospora litoralis TaxID=2498135 RepID=UPI001F6152C0|nr:cellulose binding domain-containing protein [Streptomonospora litoralis]